MGRSVSLSISTKVEGAEGVGDYVSAWSEITHPWRERAAIVVNSFLLWKAPES